MAISKLIFNGVTQMDLTQDTVEAAATLSGTTGHKNDGEAFTGSVPTITQATPTATKGAVSNHSVSVTPSVTNSAGYIAGGTKTGTAVTVTAAELVSGSQTVTQNSTVDVINLAEVVVNVPSGGASNFVHGSFTASTTTGSVNTVTIPYTGSGYPVAAVVVVKGGAYNSAVTDWYDKIQRYAVGQWTFSKSVMTSTPSYGTSGSQNQGVTTWVFKNNASSATNYSRSSAMNTNVLSSSAPTGAGATCVRIQNRTTLRYYVASTSYGLLAGLEYEYFIAYSS